MNQKISEKEYNDAINDCISKLSKNGMELIEVIKDGEYLSNIKIVYRCKRCGSISSHRRLIHIKENVNCPKKCQNIKWNYDACFNEAKKYSHSDEFKKNSGGAYSSAWNNDWLKDYIWFEKPKTEPLIWNYENTYNEAKKYDSRFAFSKGSSGAYVSALRNSWLDDYIWFKKSYQDVQCEDIINKLNKRLEKFPDLYYNENDLIDYKAGRGVKIRLYCKKHPDEFIERNLRSLLYQKLPTISYCPKCVAETQMKYKSFDEMIEELKKYKTLKEVTEADQCLVTNLRKTKEGRKYLDMLEHSISAWKRGIYSYEFDINEKKYIYVGLTCDFNRRDNEHRNQTDSSVYKFSIKNNINIPTMKIENDYVDWDLARHLECYYIDLYEDKGYILLNKKPGGSLGSVNLKNQYTFETALADIRKNNYKNINDISHRNCSLYNQIIRHINDGDTKWNELLPEMSRNSIGYWDNYDNTYFEAKKYKSKKEFSKKNGTAYRSALKHKWINDYTWFENLKTPKHTYEHCKEMASLCHSVNEFREKYPGEYNKSANKKWIYDFFEYVTNERTGKYEPAIKKLPETKKWTYEECYKIALTCTCSSEFHNKNACAYNKSMSKGWLKDYTWFVKRNHRVPLKWTYEAAYVEAKKYEYYNDFCKNSASCMQAAKKYGWIDDYTWLKRQLDRTMTKEKCLSIAHNYEYIKDFREKETSAYGYAKRNGLWEEIKTFLKYDEIYLKSLQNKLKQ